MTAEARRPVMVTILPIVERELRVAARGRNSGHARIATTLFGVLVAAAFLALGRNTRFQQSGEILFLVLMAYAFLFVLLAGVFTTADCLSEEKRTGTLGFLFLTDLKGYDVVLGKFAARALGPFYAICAIVPVTAVSLVMGGVTGGEFWRLTAVLLNTLFLSLAAGMFISSKSRQSQRAVAGTLALLFAILSAHGLSLLAGLANAPAGLGVPAWISPTFTFVAAFQMNYATGPGAFWGSLAVTNGIGWLLLASASFTVQSAWQDKPRTGVERVVASKVQGRSRESPGDQPLPWLLRSSPGTKLFCWGLAILWSVGATIAIALSAMDRRDAYWMMTFAVSKVAVLVLKVVFVMIACRFFTEARRSGLLEILLCVPLTNTEIIRAQWRSLWRLFAGPLTLFCAPLFLRTLLGWDAFDRHSELSLLSVFTGYGSAGLLALNTITDFVALGWVGMWFAASLKSPALAPGLTVLLVLLLPSLFFCVPAFLVNVLFVVWARTRLGHGFRRTISEQYSGVPMVV